MANKINIRCRRLIALFCIILIFGALFPVWAYADSVTVSTSYSPSYFQTYSSQGQWVGIGTPKHYIVETGQPVFCVQTEKTEPTNAGYSEVNGESIFSSYEVRHGIEIILQNGYPTTTGGFSDDEARYATANAIRFFLVDCGEPYVPAWMNLNSYSQFFRAAPGYEELWQWCLYLRELANNQVSIPTSTHRISLSASSLNLTEDGLNYTGSFTVTLTGCEGGYELDESALPFGSGVAGYSGNSGDVLTVLIPTDYSGDSFTLRLVGKGYRYDSGLQWYTPYNTSLQNVVTYVGVSYGELYEADTAQIQLNTPVEEGNCSITVRKTSAIGGDLPGAQFELILPSGGSMYAVSDESGIAKFNNLSHGLYELYEIKAPDGYVRSENCHQIYLHSGNENDEITIINIPEIITGSLKVLKTDADGTPLEGAMFVLTTPDNTEIYTYTDEDGIAMYNDLPLGEYILRENTAPAGYVKDENSYTVNITSKGEVIEKTVVNEKEIIKSCIIIHKRDAKGHGLTGAVFALEKSEDGGITWELVDSYTSDESGEIVIPELIADENIGYRITETSTVPGYILHTEPVFAGSLVDYGNAELSLTVCNCPNIAMPFTGGEGFNYIYIITGLMSIMGLFIFKRRNANEEN